MKVFNKLWAEMALVDSFYPLILVHSHLSVKTSLASIFLSLCETSLFFPHLPSFLSFPISLLGCWLGCCGSTSPRLLSGTNFKKLGWKKKTRKGKYGERKKEREDPLALRSLFNYSNGRCPSALVLSAWFEY